MKKIITVLISLYLFTFFLVYAGVLRNNRNPVSVAEYYLQCMENQEWVLTYQVTKPCSFDHRKVTADVQKRFRNKRVGGMELELLNNDGNIAHVHADIFYKDVESVEGLITLERVGRNWLISNVQYGR